MDETHEHPDVSSADAKLHRIEKKLDFFSRQLKRLAASADLPNLKNETSGIEYSKFGSTLAFLLCSIRHITHKIDGNKESVQTVSIKLNRIKNYMKKINDLQMKEAKKRPKVDRMAASRMIKSSC